MSIGVSSRVLCPGYAAALGPRRDRPQFATTKIRLSISTMVAAVVVTAIVRKPGRTGAHESAAHRRPALARCGSATALPADRPQQAGVSPSPPALGDVGALRSCF